MKSLNAQNSLNCKINTKICFFVPTHGNDFLGLLVVQASEWRMAETRVSEGRRESKVEQIDGEVEEEIDHDGVHDDGNDDDED